MRAFVEKILAIFRSEPVSNPGLNPVMLQEISFPALVKTAIEFGLRNEIATKFGSSRSTIDRWAAETTSPVPEIKAAVRKFIYSRLTTH